VEVEAHITIQIFGLAIQTVQIYDKPVYFIIQLQELWYLVIQV